METDKQKPATNVRPPAPLSFSIKDLWDHKWSPAVDASHVQKQKTIEENDH